jgi:hypothetical protein
VDNTDDNASASDVRNIFTGTDAGAHFSWNTDPFLTFATSTAFTTSAWGLEHCANIVCDSAARDR